MTPKDIALAYVDALARKDIDAIAALLADDVVLVGPAATRTSAAEVLAALRRLGAVHVRSDVKRTFTSGDQDACVIYDLVTDTAVGAVPTVEWVHVEAGKIRAIHLYYDQLPWQRVLAELAERQKKAQATA